MIARIIEASVRNRAAVALVVLLMAGLGAWSLREMRLDALPDLSDVQVVVLAEFPGQNPQVVDDQVTYPLSTALLAVPGARDVRGVSMFEQSFVYVLFEDGTDLYWARSRVLEVLSVVRQRLPEGVVPQLGPDATGVGWVFQYALIPGWYCAAHPGGLWQDEEAGHWYADREQAAPDRRAELVRVRGFREAGECPVDRTPLVAAGLDLAQLRSLQDWFLRYPLTAVPGVSEVASFGGFVRQYQVTVDPHALHAFGLGLEDLVTAIQRSNQDIGGSVLERAEHEYMVRSRGYLRGIDDLLGIPVGMAPSGFPVRLGQVARVAVGGEARRGVGELDGVGEAVGGIVVARFGENAYRVIHDVRQRIEELEEGLPPGVFVFPTYDRSALIQRAVGTLGRALVEELLVVGGICVLFLGHARSALVALLSLPVGLLLSILVLQALGLNANIMSLGGLALALGVMVDSAVVMVENAHRHLEREREREGPARPVPEVILGAACEVGPSLFFSLLIITVAFLPIFSLGDQSGRLFQPLAWTKSLAILAGALLGITLVPVLMVSLIRGRVPREEDNPVNRLAMRLYEPLFRAVMRAPRLTLGVVFLLGVSTWFPWSRLGEEFMPALDEGDLLYMPTTDAGISVTKSRELLQQTDRLIAAFPEVRSVHGKIGRAETATDPAPLSMIETVVQLHTDPSRWRSRSVSRLFSDWPSWLKAPFVHSFWPESRPITLEELKFGWQDVDGTWHPGLQDAVRLPGLANAWPYPIENRINMLSTGIKTPVGVKILGPDLATLGELAARTAAVLGTLPGTLSAHPERTVGGTYLDFTIDRDEAARFGLTVGDVQDAVQVAIGGRNLTTTVEGLERYPVNLRYARELRDDVFVLRQVLVKTPRGGTVPLGQLGEFALLPGAPMIRSENAQRAAWVYVDIAGRDLGSFVREARQVVGEKVPLPAGYARVWSGRFEQLQAANRRLAVVLPVTLGLIVLLLYVANRSWFRVAVILLAVPFSLIGAFWFLWLLGYDLSLAVWVGIIALLGVDAETGQVMLLYLDEALERSRREGRMNGLADLHAAIHEGAVRRIRPKTMTVLTDMIGLLPLLWATGTGADVTRRLVAPLIGGIGVSFLMELLVYPVIFLLVYGRPWRRAGAGPA